MNPSKAQAVKECDTPVHRPTEQLKKLTRRIHHIMTNESIFIVRYRKEYKQIVY